MKNLFFSLSLFIIMICAILFSTSFLIKTNDHLVEHIDSIKSYVENDMWEEASVEFDTLFEHWIKESKLIAIFINHNDLDNVTNEIYRLKEYIEIHERGESVATLGSIYYYFNKIINLEKIRFENIL